MKMELLLADWTVAQGSDGDRDRGWIWSGDGKRRFFFLGK
jgi:hypothetical protein